MSRRYRFAALAPAVPADNGPRTAGRAAADSFLLGVARTGSPHRNPGSVKKGRNNRFRREGGVAFLPLARLGAMHVGVAPGWLAGQLVGLVAFSALAYASVARQLGTSLSPQQCLWVGAVLLGALNLTVLIHEAGHVLAAAASGVRVQAVVLVAYGGATIREVSQWRNVDRWTAAGGPLANLAAAALGGALLFSIPAESALAPVLMIASAFQALSALVNLAPLPRCDGSRIFR